MAPTQFHPFVKLPVELRLDIYRLATPPRVVQEDFCETLRTTLNPIKLDSSLEALAYNWRVDIPSHGNQRTLESFGFTSTKPPVRPWVPTSSAPEIPLDWLCENPHFAWEFARRCSLYSNAPIPALLHTCKESRAALIKMGYKLAFRSRSSGPRTWFNFDRDTLYMEYDDVDYIPENDKSGVLNGYSAWDIGQFDPAELRQVRKLALWGGAKFLAFFPTDKNFDGYAMGLLGILRPFNGLVELLLVDWSPGDFTTNIPKDESESEPDSEPESEAQLDTEHQKRHAYDTNKLWSCTDVVEADGLLHLFSSNPLYKVGIESAGPESWYLVDHKEQHGIEANYFKDTQNKIRNFLTNEMVRVMSEGLDEDPDTIIPWEIPRLRTVHILWPLEHETLMQERRNVSQHVFNLQHKWASIARSIPGPSQRSGALDRVERAFGAAHFPEDGPWEYEDDDSDAFINRVQKMWWVQEGPVPDVGDLFT
ncbi:hypothetical protein Neosp_004176 [[Neocosmospora] mangrovei]